MKKLIKSTLLLAGAALLFAGCSKEMGEVLGNGDTGSGEQTVTFEISTDANVTKAVQDGDGAAANVNHWVMEVRDNEGDVYNRQEEAGPEGTTTHSFTVRLIKGQTYNVLFWADNDGTYDVADLKNVKLVASEQEGYVASKDSRDAFSAAVNGFKLTNNQTTATHVELHRPFAQLNVIFTDLDDLFATMPSEEEYLKFKPIDFKAVASLPTTFNVETQTAGAPVETPLNITAAGDYLDNYNTHRAEETLFMDYFFATEGAKDIVNINFSFTSNGEAIAHNFDNIPFQRNWRTNIKGELLSSNATFEIEVIPAWDGYIDHNIITAGSVAAANQALAQGETDITIINPSDLDTPVQFPSASSGKLINLQTIGTSGKTVTIKTEDGTDGPATLYIKSDAANLNVNTPQTHVEILTGNYSEVTAKTSATTLVVAQDVVISSLKVNGGNADIYGCVGSVTKASGVTITYYVGTVASLCSLREAINSNAWCNGKIYLTSDIDLANAEWTPINGWGKNLDIDGQNYVVKNLMISEASGDYSGFISATTGITIKNLTIDGAEVVYPESVGESARVGIIAGQLYGGSTVENCHVKNAKITACQKTGGLIGFIEGDCSTPYLVKDCSVENISIKSNDPNKILQHGTGGFIGFIPLRQCPLITITGCSAKDITISNFRTEPYEASELQRVPHAFIGAVCTSYEGSEAVSESAHSVVLSNNTVSGNNTELPTCIYSSPYFGWAGNAEERPTWKGNVYIDGQKWVPDYAFECGGVKYCTLDQAIAAAAASADKTVRVIKAGEYTVEQLNAKDCTIEAAVEGVVFNHTSGSGKWITSEACATVTVKNLTWNVGNANYQMMYANLEGCTVNGMFNTGATQTFKNCNFVNHEGYNMWIYGTDATFEGCIFTCPGKNDGVPGCGSAMNVYNEGSAVTHTLVVKDCQFTAEASSNKYPAIYIKPEVGYNVTITNTTANNNFFTNAISGSKVWGLKDNTNKKHSVTVDGKLVYANGSMLVLSTPAQLVAFSSAVNGGNTFAGKTVYLENDVDMTGIEWAVAGNSSNHFWGTFDGQNHTVSNLTINNDSTEENVATGFFGWLSNATVKNVNFVNANVTGHHDVGVIAGYMQSVPTCTITNCTVSGSTISCTYKEQGVEGDGDKCGAIVGFAANGGTSVTGCTVSNTTISACRDAGQVAGAAKEVNVSDCTATNVNVSWNGKGKGTNINNAIIGRIIND